MTRGKGRKTKKLIEYYGAEFLKKENKALKSGEKEK
ncbi:hypothetical protein ES702_07754 [subsurface metagenome]